LLKRSLYILYKTVNNIVDKPIFQELFMLIERDYLVGYKKIPTFAPIKDLIKTKKMIIVMLSKTN